ncbi:hypothetical protein DFJ74DRAFT_725088 [Hyaloraphidium curvatum]|nr:hypothetical protein DFJ74DRAFT_725088 [Hyaloraphidium curvatum]
MSNNGLGALAVLPNEILLKVFGKATDLRDLLKLRHVSRTLRWLMATPLLWRRLDVDLELHFVSLGNLRGRLLDLRQVATSSGSLAVEECHISGEYESRFDYAGAALRDTQSKTIGSLNMTGMVVLSADFLSACWPNLINLKLEYFNPEFSDVDWRQLFSRIFSNCPKLRYLDFTIVEWDGDPIDDAYDNVFPEHATSSIQHFALYASGSSQVVVQCEAAARVMPQLKHLEITDRYRSEDLPDGEAAYSALLRAVRAFDKLEMLSYIDDEALHGFELYLFLEALGKEPIASNLKTISISADDAAFSNVSMLRRALDDVFWGRGKMKDEFGLALSKLEKIEVVLHAHPFDRKQRHVATGIGRFETIVETTT